MPRYGAGRVLSTLIESLLVDAETQLVARLVPSNAQIRRVKNGIVGATVPLKRQAPERRGVVARDANHIRIGNDFCCEDRRNHQILWCSSALPNNVTG